MRIAGSRPAGLFRGILPLKTIKEELMNLRGRKSRGSVGGEGRVEMI